MSQNHNLILGIDPGTNIAGIGLISQNQGKVIYIGSTHVKFKKDDSLERKLFCFFQEISVWIETHRPTCVAVESIFHHKNARSAIVLAHARGAALLAAAHHGIPVFEYTPLEVKTAVTGYGRAEKSQVSQMIHNLFPPLKSKQIKYEDETDALAVAYCHMSSQKIKNIGGLTEKRVKEKSRTWDDWLAARIRTK